MINFVFGSDDPSTGLHTFKTLAGQARRYTSDELRIFSHGNIASESVQGSDSAEVVLVSDIGTNLSSSAEVTESIPVKPKIIPVKAPRRSNRLDDSMGVTSSSESVSNYSDSFAKPTKVLRAKRPKPLSVESTVRSEAEEDMDDSKGKEVPSAPSTADELPIRKKSRTTTTVPPESKLPSVDPREELVENKKVTALKGYGYVEDDDSVISYRFHNASTFEVDVKVSQIFGHSTALKELIKLNRTIQWLCGLKNLAQLKLLGDIANVLNGENVVSNLAIFSAALVTFNDIEKLLLLKRGAEVMIAFSEQYEVLILLQKHEPFIKFLAEKRLLDLIPPSSSWDHASHYIVAIKEGFFDDALHSENISGRGYTGADSSDANSSDVAFVGISSNSDSRGNEEHSIGGMTSSVPRSTDPCNLNESSPYIETATSIDSFLDSVLGSSRPKTLSGYAKQAAAAPGNIASRQPHKPPHVGSSFDALASNEGRSHTATNLREWGWGDDPWIHGGPVAKTTEVDPVVDRNSRMPDKTSTEIYRGSGNEIFPSKGSTASRGNVRNNLPRLDDCSRALVELSDNSASSSLKIELIKRSKLGDSDGNPEGINDITTSTFSAVEGWNDGVSNYTAEASVLPPNQCYSTDATRWGWGEDPWRKNGDVEKLWTSRCEGPTEESRSIDLGEEKEKVSPSSYSDHRTKLVLSRSIAAARDFKHFYETPPVDLTELGGKGEGDSFIRPNDGNGSMHVSTPYNIHGADSKEAKHRESSLNISGSLESPRSSRISVTSSSPHSTRVHRGTTTSALQPCSANAIGEKYESLKDVPGKDSSILASNLPASSPVGLIPTVRRVKVVRVYKSENMMNDDTAGVVAKHSTSRKVTAPSRVVVSDSNRMTHERESNDTARGLRPSEISCKRGKLCDKKGCRYNHMDKCKFGADCRIFRIKDFTCRFAHEI